MGSIELFDVAFIIVILSSVSALAPLFLPSKKHIIIYSSLSLAILHLFFIYKGYNFGKMSVVVWPYIFSHFFSIITSSVIKIIYLKDFKDSKKGIKKKVLGSLLISIGLILNPCFIFLLIFNFLKWFFS